MLGQGAVAAPHRSATSAGGGIPRASALARLIASHVARVSLHNGRRTAWAVPPLAKAANFGGANVRLAVELLIALSAAFLIRCALFGNPVIHSDEQFYLLVGDRMLHGALPYVDLWDRKPVGLFLLYAAIRLLGGDGIVQYQIVATLFAAAAAFLIIRIAGHVGDRRGAIAAGIIYLLWLLIFNGAGGQSPVFYNALIAGAALVLVRLATHETATLSSIRQQGGVAMALVGAALQIKYSVVFEGVFFGLWLLWRSHRAGCSGAALLVSAMIWIAIALAPTAAALLDYVALGHGRAFVYANFLSVFGREGDSAHAMAGRVLFMVAGSAPLLFCAAAGLRSASGRSALARRFVRHWLIAALGGVLLFGTYYDHYFLPVLVPLCVAGAPAFGAPGRSGWPSRTLAGVALFGLVAGAAMVRMRVAARGNASEVAALVRVVHPRLHGCLYLFGSEPILYHLTGACLVTPYAFRSHLGGANEAASIGVDPRAEMRRLFARKPAIVVMREPGQTTNMAALSIVERTLAHDYRRIATRRIGVHRHFVYERRTP